MQRILVLAGAVLLVTIMALLGAMAEMQKPGSKWNPHVVRIQEGDDPADEAVNLTKSLQAKVEEVEAKVREVDQWHEAHFVYLEQHLADLHERVKQLQERVKELEASQIKPKIEHFIPQGRRELRVSR